MPKKKAWPLNAGKSKRRRDKEGTRERILVTAHAEFSAKGYTGGRIEVIAAKTPVNVRMIYHYFGGKAGLYVAVLERGLQNLRAEEQNLAVTGMNPVAGLLSLFDFVFNHFASHPELVNLLSSENLHKAAFLKRSRLVPRMSFRTIGIIKTLLASATPRKGSARPDPLQLYVTMVSLSYFHLSNAHTLSILFRANLLDRAWVKDRHLHARMVLEHYLRAMLR
jgi:AcrR family transcriptional regulator